MDSETDSREIQAHNRKVTCGYLKIFVVSAFIQLVGFSYTYGYYVNNYWCNPKHENYNFDECYASVRSDATSSAVFWPIFWAKWLGVNLVPSFSPINREGDWREVLIKKETEEKGKE